MKRLRTLKRLWTSLVLLTIVLGLTLVFSAGRVLALSEQYYSDNTGTPETCDLDDCPNTEVRLITAQTRFVQKTSTNVVAYFTADNGHLVIYGGNFCPAQSGNPDLVQSGDYFDTTPLPDNAKVTSFTVNGSTQYGIKPTDTADCNKTITYTLTNLPADPDHPGLFYAKITVNPFDNHPGTCDGASVAGCDGLQNSFYVQETDVNNNYVIAQQGAQSGIGTGYDVTAQEDSGPDNITYKVRFGTNCTVPAGGVDASVSYYDMDNGSGGSGAQLNGPVTMEIIDATTGDQVASWTPADLDNAVGSHLVHFAQYGRYIWEIHNVYKNNTIQFSTPFDGIYYMKSCSPPVIPPPVIPPPPPPAQPYFQAKGGDVVAGASMAADIGTPCKVAPHIKDAGIVSWNKDGSPNFAGAGGQYAAFAMNQIQDFVTGQGNPLQEAVGTETNRLTFSNINDGGSVNTATGLFGGLFGKTPCADYWNAHPTATTALPSPGWASGTYYVKTDTTISGATIAAGAHVTLYVDGNVSITGNIVYGTFGGTDRNQIPSLKLIVHGNIYIDPAVTTLDGLYAAIPDADYATTKTQAGFGSPSAGTISTCSKGFTSYNPMGIQTTDTDYYASCGKQLVFNGSVVAGQLWMLRTYSSLLATTPQPAEVFNYDPEIWLAPATSNGTTDTGYQSIVGLPPVL